MGGTGVQKRSWGRGANPPPTPAWPCHAGIVHIARMARMARMAGHAIIVRIALQRFAWFSLPRCVAMDGNTGTHEGYPYDRCFALPRSACFALSSEKAMSR